MVSGWLHHTEGLSARNLALLDEWANVIRNLRGPWIVAADWNCTPKEMSETLWIERVHGVVVAPGECTCNDRTIDFFVVSKTIAHAVHDVYRIDDVAMSPHFPVRLLLRTDLR